MNLTSDDGLCKINWQTGGRNPLKHQLVVKHMCTHDEVGQGTMVMGAVGQYAYFLAASINDVANAPTPSLQSSKYVLSCTVDARDIFEYRVVTLDLQASNSSGARYARLLKSTGKLCSGPQLDRALAATAAAANWQTLMQNDGADGWIDLLWEASGYGREPPYAFSNSATALEDVLGLVAALVTSRFNSSTTDVVNSTVVVTATQIGNGKIASLAFAIPSAVAAILLPYLIIRTSSLDPVRYNSRKLGDLIDLGGSKARETQLMKPYSPMQQSTAAQRYSWERQYNPKQGSQ
jgi:hypothetical protein